MVVLCSSLLFLCTSTSLVLDFLTSWFWISVGNTAVFVVGAEMQMYWSGSGKFDVLGIYPLIMVVS